MRAWLMAPARAASWRPTALLVLEASVMVNHRPACGHARYETGIAPREMLRRRLLAGALIELFGKIAARRRERANGFEKSIAVRDPLPALVAAGRVCRSGHEAELRSSKCREIVGTTGVVDVAFV